MNEQEYVAGQFQNAFIACKKEPIVLYGLGKNTEAILSQTQGFHFVGLMDSQNTGNEFWGLKVLTEEEALKLASMVVIVARESIVPIIYERIAHLQDRYGLQIYDFKGHLLGRQGWMYNNKDLPYWSVAEEDLKQAIDMHECISFDVFDTLIMRRVLEPRDVFDIEERMLEERGYVGNNFKERRVQAEQSIPGCPTIHQIYQEMGRLYQITDEELEEWRKLEFEIEEKVIVPRHKMIELYQYALEQGKKVFLISDMYYSCAELERILHKYNVKEYDGFLVSCEHQESKANGGLYAVYQQKTEGMHKLHIGDNRRSDGERAQEQGIDFFQIYSGYEMWMASSMQITLANVESLEQRCILGDLVWRCCEDPFALHATQGVIAIDVPEKLGYIFLGGLYDEFVSWFVRKMRENRAEQLLLPGRDGFLINQMLMQCKDIDFDIIYFKTSRRAVSVAAIQSEEDILLLAEREFQGTYGELLLRRFGVCPRADDKVKECSAKSAQANHKKEYVLSYKEEILRHSEQERKAYIAYLDELKIRNNKKQVIFDFVAGGTVQYFLQKLLGKKIQGMYFATMNHPNEKYHLEDYIISAYGNIHSYGSENQVGKHYLFLETIMVDGCTTLERIEKGEFIYEQNEGSDFAVIQNIQKGILNYQSDMRVIKELLPDWHEERAFVDELFGRLFGGNCEVDVELKKAFVNDDVFDGGQTYPVWGD